MRFAHRRRPMDNRKRLPTGPRLCPQGPPAYPLHVDNALRAPARRAFAHIPLSQLWICTIRNQSSYISDGYSFSISKVLATGTMSHWRHDIGRSIAPIERNEPSGAQLASYQLSSPERTIRP